MENKTRHLVLADVHGNISALEAALSNIGYSESTDILINLGDTIDRGKHTKECLEFFAGLRDRGRTVVMLAGNHEALLIEALQGNISSLDMWLSAGFGSRATLSSYHFDAGRIATAGSALRVDGKQIRRDQDVEEFLLNVVGERHLALIQLSERSYYLKNMYDPGIESPGVDAFLCHAGLTSGLRISETSPRRLVWGDEDWIRRRVDHPEPLLIIYGHWHGDRPVIRHKGICLAIEGGVAVMSVEDHVIVTNDGELIEIRREWLGI
jgi:hypothetical protein